MISDRARAALDALAAMGWSVQLSAEPRPLPPQIDRRYPAIPTPVRAFVESLELCTRRGEQVWFLVSADYAIEGSDETAWNEWERIESEADAAPEIVAFWDKHLPILNSVAGDYAYLAVCVDPASPTYGTVVRGDAPDFRETTMVSRSFEKLCEQIVQLQQGGRSENLDDLFLDSHDERNLASNPSPRFFERLAGRFRALPLFERYRIGVVVEERLSRPLWLWENWSTILPPLETVAKGIGAPATIRPRQAGDRDNWLRFGTLPWNEASNRTWTTKYLADPTLVGKVHFFATEIWAPSRATSFEARRGPEFFCLLDRDEVADTQGFVLALRKDVLRRVDVAADETIYSVREFFEKSSYAVFERSWGERGRFGSTVVFSGLDRTDSTAVLSWAKANPRAHVRSFRWR